MINVVIRSREYDDAPASERIGARVIIRKGDMYLFSYLGKRDQYLFPGGGMEDGESPMQGAERECMEECGLIAEAEKPFLIIDEYYFEKHWRNYYMMAHITGKTSPRHDLKEDELELQPVWVSNDEIGKLPAIQMNWNDIPHAPLSTIFAVRNSHFREYIAYRIANNMGLPEIPAQLSDIVDLGHADQFLSGPQSS